MGTKCKLHIERSQLGFEPGLLLLRAKTANHYTTMPDSSNFSYSFFSPLVGLLLRKLPTEGQSSSTNQRYRPISVLSYISEFVLIKIQLYHKKQVRLFLILFWASTESWFTTCTFLKYIF